MKKQQNNSSASLTSIMAVLAIFLVGNPVYSFQKATGVKGVKTELNKTGTENELVIDDIDDLILKEMEAKKIPAVSIAVIKNNQVIKEKAYGFASIELNVPATLNTSYSLASMTKVFTASAIMLLVEDGKISLDESITKVLPQLPAQWSHVTIRHCLSHSSGLPDAITDDVNVTMITGDRNELFEILAKKPLKQAGENSVYNQTGYILLGMIIEKLSGMQYEQFIKTRILSPFKITGAEFGDGWSIILGRSNLYTSLKITADHSKLFIGEQGPVVMEDKIVHYGSKYMPDYMAPAGLINGTIRDLINLEKAFDIGSLLKPETLKLMSTPYKLSNGKNGDFGLGFVTVSFGGSYNSISYGGGAATWRLSYPDRKLTVIVLTNLQGSQPHGLAARVAAIVDPEVAEK
jgi:D-alanyl-D-alanine carboxypeptidase